MEQQAERMHGGRAAIMALVLAVPLLLLSCTSTPSPAPGAGPGTFEEVNGLQSVNQIIASEKRPFVMFYYSPRCGYCSLMLQTIRRDLAEFGPDALIYKVNLDENPDVRQDKGIGPVPVLVFYRNGKEVDRWRTYRPGFLLRSRFRDFFLD